VRRGKRIMKSYKGWTAAERRKSGEKAYEAIQKGIIPPPTKCNRCGQDKGIIDYHNHDYSHPYKYREELCVRCHMMLHFEERSKEAVEKYWEEIKAGKRYPPVYDRKKILGIIRKEHGVT
jgi:hypothetical protein